MTDVISNNQNEMGTFEKIYNVFFAPKMTFESIDRKPDWLAPMVIGVLIAFLVGMLIMPVIMPQEMQKQRVKMEERGMSPEEIDRAVEMGQKISKIAGPVGALVGPLVYLLVIAGVFLFVGNIILGGKTTFKKLFSVVCYSSLIGSLYSLILLPLILTKQTIDVHFSLASFLSTDASETFLYQSLKKIDLFNIWQIIVMGIGIAVVYKFTTKKSTTMVALLYIIYAVISIALSSLF